MSQADWELIEMHRAQAKRAIVMADCFEAAAYDAARATGFKTVEGQTAFALGWLAHRCAERIVRLEAARDVPDPSAQGAAAPVPDTPQRGGVTPIRPRASRK